MNGKRLSRFYHDLENKIYQNSSLLFLIVPWEHGLTLTYQEQNSSLLVLLVPEEQGLPWYIDIAGTELIPPCSTSTWEQGLPGHTDIAIQNTFLVLLVPGEHCIPWHIDLAGAELNPSGSTRTWRTWFTLICWYSGIRTHSFRFY